MVARHHCTRVADLINEQGTGWDDGELAQVLTDSDAYDVKKIVIGGVRKMTIGRGTTRGTGNLLSSLPII